VSEGGEGGTKCHVQAVVRMPYLVGHFSFTILLLWACFTTVTTILYYFVVCSYSFMADTSPFTIGVSLRACEFTRKEDVAECWTH
jgi:hypothetical protein